MNADGGRTHQLTRRGFNDLPSWSPDGRKIAFSSNPSCMRPSYGCLSRLQIYVMNSNGSHRQRLTRPGTIRWFPRWSPEGRTIAFASERGTKDVIDLMTVWCR
jgi:TolB protein